MKSVIYLILDRRHYIFYMLYEILIMISSGVDVRGADKTLGGQTWGNFCWFGDMGGPKLEL